ncbi:hypothetical protein D6Y11_23680 [Vibrio parahaemolyticus]|nr:hypothetical protein [Vibrio parahaemolyticus]
MKLCDTSINNDKTNATTRLYFLIINFQNPHKTANAALRCEQRYTPRLNHCTLNTKAKFKLKSPSVVSHS